MATGEPLLVTCSVCMDCVPEKDAEIVLNETEDADRLAALSFTSALGRRSPLLCVVVT